MAWSAPMTATANTQFSAGMFNVHIRDNLLELGAAKATTAGQYFAVDGVNKLSPRMVGGQHIATSQGTTSITYTDLATAGPSVTVDTGMNCLVWICAGISTSDATRQGSASVQISGATVGEDPSDDWRIMVSGQTASNVSRVMACRRMAFLNPGTNTFTMKYRSEIGTSTATFSNRMIIALPL